MAEIKLSIIIPVYNVESYLKECVESIQHQITTECEIVLVDDGSTDCSGMICDEYASSDQRIRTIHQENGGHSSARNCGLDIAKGKYVCFVDSDDRVYENSIAEILNWIDKCGADMCFMHGYKLFPNGTVADLGDGIHLEYVEGKTVSEVWAYIGSRPKYPGSACTKVFRRGFLIDNHLRFPEDLTHSEDLTFCFDCLLMAKTFSALDVPYYLYRQCRPGSMTSVVNSNSVNGLMGFIRRSIQKLTEQPPKPKFECYIHLFPILAYEYSILLWQYGLLPKGEYKNSVYNMLQECRWVLAYGTTSKLRIINLLSNVIGIKGISRMLVAAMKLRGMKNRK